MTDTSFSNENINSSLKLRLVLEGLRYTGDLEGTHNMTPEFVKVKGKMAPSLIEAAIQYLEGDQDKFIKNPLPVITSVIRHVDKLMGTFSILEPNMGHLTNMTSGSVSSGNQASFLPKIQSFSGEPEDGWNFIETFKLQSSNLEPAAKIAAFGIAIGSKALKWFNDNRHRSWEVLEANFKRTWCQTLLPMDAVERVKKVKQPEEGHIRNYITAFEEYKRYFDSHVSVAGIIDLFLKNVRPGLKSHVISLKKKNLSWADFISVIQDLDNEEFRDEERFTKKKGVAASVSKEIDGEPVNLDSESGEVLSVEGEVKELKAMFGELLKKLDKPGGLEGSNSQKIGSGNLKRNKMSCWNCGSTDHFIRNCPNAKKKKSGKVDSSKKDNSEKGRRN